MAVGWMHRTAGWMHRAAGWWRRTRLMFHAVLAASGQANPSVARSTTVSSASEVPMPAAQAAATVAVTGRAGACVCSSQSADRSPTLQPTRHRSVFAAARRHTGRYFQNSAESPPGASEPQAAGVALTSRAGAGGGVCLEHEQSARCGAGKCRCRQVRAGKCCRAAGRQVRCAHWKVRRSMCEPLRAELARVCGEGGRSDVWRIDPWVPPPHSAW